MKSKKHAFLAVLLLICVLLSACNPFPRQKLAIFTINLKDKIKIALDTNGGYSITADFPFSVYSSAQKLGTGKFISAGEYQEFLNQVILHHQHPVLDKGHSQDGHRFLFWQDSEGFHYALLLEELDAGILFSTDISQECAQDCFERMHISVELGE